MFSMLLGELLAFNGQRLGYALKQFATATKPPSPNRHYTSSVWPTARPLVIQISV